REQPAARRIEQGKFIRQQPPASCQHGSAERALPRARRACEDGGAPGLFDHGGMENQELMGIAVNAPVEAPLGPGQSDPPGKRFERAPAVGQEPGLRLPPRPPAGRRRHTDAKVADLAFVARRKVRIGETEILDETADRRVQPEHKWADPRAQSGTAEPLAQLIQRQIADLYAVDGAISPSSSNSRTKRSIICNDGLSSAISNWSARRRINSCVCAASVSRLRNASPAKRLRWCVCPDAGL